MAIWDLEWARLEGRDGHTAGRQLLASLWRRHGDGPMPEILVTERGKPYFASGRLHFSISHTKEHVFCCLSDRPVGIDAEEAERKLPPRIAERFLSETERRRWEQAADRDRALLRLWILKEARAKASGSGIGYRMRQTDFTPEDPRIREIDGCLLAIWTGTDSQSALGSPFGGAGTANSRD